MHTIAIVGASLAGVSSARALRERGFDGHPVAVFAMNQPKVFGRWRRELTAAVPEPA